MNSDSKTKSHSERPAKDQVPFQSDNGWLELKNILNGRFVTSQITLVVGAGIHQVPKHTDPRTYESSLLLSSWDALLKRTFPHLAASSSPSLSWELGLQGGSRNISANERNKHEFRRVQTAIRNAERVLLLSPQSYALVTRVLRSTRIKDIISLNLDLVVEHLLSSSADDPPRVTPATTRTDRHRVVNGIKVWHTHGDRSLNGSECLSLRSYGLSIAQIEIARCRFKRWERKPENNRKRKRPANWMEALLQDHLIMVGCSLNIAEWDIWFALVNRWRNYAKAANKRDEPKTFVLTTSTEHQHLPSQFLRLRATSYDQGWDWLGKLLDQTPKGRVRRSP